MGNTLPAITTGKATLLCLPQPDAVAGAKKPQDAAITDKVCRADPAASLSTDSLLIRRSDSPVAGLPTPSVSAGVTVGGRHAAARPRVAGPVAAAAVPAARVPDASATAIAASNIPAANDPAALTAGFQPETRAAIERVKARPWTADIMVAHSSDEAVSAFKAIIAKTPELQSAARRNGITDDNLAMMLGSTAFQHGVRGAGTDMVLSIPRDPVFFAQMVMRKNQEQGANNPAVASLAAHAAQTLATHDIDFRVGQLHQSPEAATQGFAAAAAAGWQQLHASNPSEYPAFDRAAATEVSQLVTRGYRNSASYDARAYNPSDDTDYFSDYDFEEPLVGDPVIAAPAYGLESEQRRVADRSSRGDTPIGAAGEVVRGETVAQRTYLTGVNLRRQHAQTVEQGRAQRLGQPYIPHPAFTRVS